jgi:leader peptidase (prepilin peptidase)/N-methyltransferase
VAPSVRRLTPPAAAVGAALAVGTFIDFGRDANAALWALVQVALVALATIDLATRRLPNVITLPVAVLALVLRGAAERPHLTEVAIAGVAAFVAFYVIAFIARGGFGMGDVKLTAMLGFLLGSKVVSALVLGILAGGLWAAILLAARRGGLRSSFAYGPYLCLGAAVAILLSNPPPLV